MTSRPAQEPGQPANPLDAYEAPRVELIGSLEELTRGATFEIGSDPGTLSVD